MTLNAMQLEQALRATAEHLNAKGVVGPVRLYLVGGSAGLLRGWLGETRSTADVDVTTVDPVSAWPEVREAAEIVAQKLLLPGSWLNDKCRMYGWCLPLGWQQRCGQIREFGPLHVFGLSHADFIAAKIVSAPNRPQDIEDLKVIGPSEWELNFAEEHIDRLEREHLDPDHSFDDCRSILAALRGQA